MASGWNLWVLLSGGGCGYNVYLWLVGVVIRRYMYIDFLITYPYSSCVSSFLQCSASLLLCVHLLNVFSFLFVIFVQYSKRCTKNI